MRGVARRGPRKASGALLTERGVLGPWFHTLVPSMGHDYALDKPADVQQPNAYAVLCARGGARS